MTVSDSGTGQQQGREVCLHGRTRQEGCKPCFWVGEQPASSSPAPPARDNERDEARESVARWLATFAGKSWPRRTETEREQMCGEVDFLLSDEGCRAQLSLLLRWPA